MTLGSPKCTCGQSKGDNLWREISVTRKVFSRFGETVTGNNNETMLNFLTGKLVMYSYNVYKLYNILK